MFAVILSFLAVSIGIVAATQLLTEFMPADRKLVRRRLTEDVSSAFSDPSAMQPTIVEAPKPPSPLLSSEEMAKLTASANLNNDTITQLNSILEQSGMRIAVWKLVGVAGLLAVTFAIATGVLLSPWLAILGALAGAIPVPALVYVRFHQRRQKFLTQLPDAFDLMARVLRAGQSIPQALMAAAETIDEPAGAELGRCFYQLNMGLSPEIAFQELARRTSLVEMRIFFMAVAIQRQTGGKLSDVLTRLAEMVRARIKLQRQIRTLTAEGRMQGNVLLVLPFVLFAVLWIIHRKYAAVLLEQPNLLIASGVAMLIGVLWIRRIIQLDI